MNAEEIYETWLNGNHKDAYLAIRDCENPAYRLAEVAARVAHAPWDEYEFLEWYLGYSDSCGDAS